MKKKKRKQTDKKTETPPPYGWKAQSTHRDVQKKKKKKTRERYPIRCGLISTNEAAAELMEPVPPITRM
jgi:hypothetical protein